MKFGRNAAETIETKLAEGAMYSEMELSDSLDKLNKRYRLRKCKPLFKNFKKRRQWIKGLLEKDKTLLARRERRILKRLKRAGKKVRVPELDRVYKIHIELEQGQSLEEVVAAYNNDPDIEYAELNYIVSVNLTPNDPCYPVQWPLNNTGQTYPPGSSGTADSDIDAPEAWDIYTGNLETIVAVVDTGVDYNHRDLTGNVWVNEAELNGTVGVDDDDNGYVDDIYGYDFINNDNDPQDDAGHGTHCAGIIAAKGNNGLDITGVCWDAKIMSLKFLGSDGYGTDAGAIEAFYYAVENGADVTSNSWGGGGYSQAVKEAIDYAHSQGVIMVAAAGNGDSNSPAYPASYDHIMAVAATDSNDEKASFSNYGDWVDVAAPGVDILSLRASRGTTQDKYTAVMSGTSMACPHVAGACALLVSINPSLTSDQVYDILMETADAISPGICLSNGRINLHNAILNSTTSEGHINLDNDYYSCSSTVAIWLSDLDIGGEGEQEVTLITSGGDLETVILTEVPPNVGVFTNSIPTSAGAANSFDEVLQVSDGDVIGAVYVDVNDGTGSPAVATDTATADCQSPIISNVQIDAPGPEPTVSFEADEPAWARIFYGLSCMDPCGLVKVQPIRATSHTIKLTGVLPETEYFFAVECIDIVGNKSIEDNAGQCYAFTTDGPGDIYVPADYNTIQEAVNRSWDGGTVWIADGRYTGPGNRDIDFKGKAIIVRSENGPENCIIDCNGTEEDPHRGFDFTSGEGRNSIVADLTITNGYGRESAVGDSLVLAGGAILCIGSGPRIVGCRIEGNGAEVGAGIYCWDKSSPIIKNCRINRNSASIAAGGVLCGESSPTISQCAIVENSAEYAGGGIFCYDDDGLMISNCTITGNSVASGDGGGVYCDWYSSPTITNSILWNNSATTGGEIAIRDACGPSHLTVSYSDVQGGQEAAYVAENCTLNWGLGNIDSNALFVKPGHWDPNGTPSDATDDFWVDGDYHLKSQGWYWHTGRKVWDWDEDETSRCIDAGNPGSPLGEELLSIPDDPANDFGQNLRINMGAYGGTAEASMPPYDWALLADLNNDGTVDFLDLADWVEYWLNTGKELPADLDRNEIIDAVDYALLARDWLLETSWPE